MCTEPWGRNTCYFKALTLCTYNLIHTQNTPTCRHRCSNTAHTSNTLCFIIAHTHTPSSMVCFFALNLTHNPIAASCLATASRETFPASQASLLKTCESDKKGETMRQTEKDWWSEGMSQEWQKRVIEWWRWLGDGSQSTAKCCQNLIPFFLPCIFREEADEIFRLFLSLCNQQNNLSPLI